MSAAIEGDATTAAGVGMASPLNACAIDDFESDDGAGRGFGTGSNATKSSDDVVDEVDFDDDDSDDD